MAGVRVIVTLNFPTPEVADQALSSMVPAFQSFKQEPGSIQYELFRSVENPNRVILMEHWASRELYDQHWLKQLREKNVPDEGQLKIMNPTFEFYPHAEYTLIDDIWQPLDPAQRMTTIRWA